MPPKRPRPVSPVPPQAAVRRPDDGFPSDKELLHELRKHGATPAAPRELPMMSRRTRDFLLVAGVGTAGIVLALVRLMSHSDGWTVTRLALTASGLFCAMLWYIFYGVMSRY